jgi:LmbE family N-acetylglucosaminyl deacetylase
MENTKILVFGAHPDDIEFGCGGVIARESLNGRQAHFVVCSAGESASYGTPEQRKEETTRAASTLGATVEFLELGGDAHFEIKFEHTVKLAEAIRRMQAHTVLSTSPNENQHPDHARLGQMVRDACRLARYGGLHELKAHPSHSIDRLFYYAVTPDGEPPDIAPIFIDVSSPEVISRWTEAMMAHGSQTSARGYVDLQLNRARVWGLRAGVEYASALYPNEASVFQSLSETGRGARYF